MNAPRVVDLSEFQTLVRAIAAERPDFRYSTGFGQSCYYKLGLCPTGTESRCLIGEALSRLGADEEWLAATDSCPMTSASYVLQKAGFARDVCHWATIVQDNQDRGLAWGDAVKCELPY